MSKRLNNLIEEMLRRGEEMTHQNTGEPIKEQCFEYVNSTNPKYAFYRMMHYLGGRSYNQFLDYGLLLLRLAAYLNTFGVSREQVDVQVYIKVKEGLSYYLLFDDRHDLWQNLPYELDKIVGEPEMWLALCYILISCINEEGTGDTHLKSENRTIVIEMEGGVVQYVRELPED